MKNASALVLSLVTVLSVAYSPTATADAAASYHEYRVESFNMYLGHALTSHAKARAYFNAAKTAVIHRNQAAAVEALRRAREALNAAYSPLGQAYDNAQVMERHNDYYWGVADTVAALLGSTALMMRTDVTTTSDGGFGTAELESPDGMFGTFYENGNIATISFPDGGYQITYPDGSTTIKVSGASDTIHLTAMGTCIGGCQIMGATVMFLPGHGQVGDYLSLPFDPIGPFAQAMMDSEARLVSQLCPEL